MASSNILCVKCFWPKASVLLRQHCPALTDPWVLLLLFLAWRKADRRLLLPLQNQSREQTYTSPSKYYLGDTIHFYT